MKLATRINSFLPKFNNDVEKVLQEFNRLGLSHVDFNYPEHVEGIPAEKMKACLEKIIYSQTVWHYVSEVNSSMAN